MTIQKLTNIFKLDLFEILTDPDSGYIYDEEWWEIYDGDPLDNPFKKIELIEKWLKIKFNNNLMKLNSYLDLF